MGIYLNPTNRKFERACTSEIYVDKSELLIQLNKIINKEKNCVCVSRPRRFGKTMAANMIAAYYGKGCDSAPLFEGLKISGNESYKAHLNQYPVIAVNIQDFLSVSNSLDELLEQLQSRILKELRKVYADVVDEDEKHLSFALDTIYVEKDEEFVFIIDEWDCILRENKFSQEDYQKYLDFIRSLLKDKSYVALAYMTGILPIKKYGTHSALNMFDELSMVDPGAYAEFVGFTEEEVGSLCEKYNRDFQKMKYWYDGYLFEPGLHIYNPKSVIDSITRQKFSNYWTQTETYEALRVYIEMNFDGLKEAIISMLAGEYVTVDPGTFQNDMSSFACRDDVLTLLIHLGYLAYNQESNCVYIPNSEIRDEFVRAVKGASWTEVIRAIEQSEQLLQSVWSGDEEKVAQIIDRCHEENTSILTYNDENSLSCVIALAFYKAMDEYTSIRELPAGKGFADVVFIPRRHSDKPALLVELKYDKTADTAIKQIKEKRYPDALAEYEGYLILVGINYNKTTKKHECIIERMMM